MTAPQLTDLISIDDLSADMRLIAQSCGLETAKKLIANCPGIQIYIPRPEHVEGLVKKLIVSRYGDRDLSDSEIKALAVELRKSPSFLRQVARS